MRENLLAVTLDEITAIRFDCKKCGATMTLTPDCPAMPAPFQCVQCNTPLAGDQTTHDLVSGFMGGLRDALKLRNDKFELRLVLKD